MSQAVRIAVSSLLVGDAGLKALLAPDPSDATCPAVFNATKNQAPAVYDCVTYRVKESTPDARFEPPQPGTGDSDVEDIYVELEAWTQTADSAPIEAIGERLKALFGNTCFAAPPDGYVFKSQRLMAATDLYDANLNAFYGLFRYRLRLQRTADTSLSQPVAPGVSAYDQLAAQIAALQTQLGDFQVAFDQTTSAAPPVTISATVTLAMPAKNQPYNVALASNTVVSLPATVGSGRLLTFDLNSLGAYTLGYTLNGSDAYDGGAVLPALISGNSFSLRDIAAGKWAIE